MRPTAMWTYYRMNSLAWAELRVRTLRKDRKRPVLVEIRPKPPATTLGAFRLPNGTFHDPVPARTRHHAVRHYGRIFDEAYPAGLPQSMYLLQFRNGALLEIVSSTRKVRDEPGFPGLRITAPPR